MKSKLVEELSKTLTPIRCERYFPAHHHTLLMCLISGAYVRFNPTGRRKIVTGGISSIYNNVDCVYLEHKYLKFFTIWIPEEAIITVKEEQVTIETA